MQIAIFFMVLLALAAATIATVAIASTVSLPAPTDQMQTVLFDAISSEMQPNGDPVDSGGGGPGTPT